MFESLISYIDTIYAVWCKSNIFGSWPKNRGANPLSACFFHKSSIKLIYTLNPSGGMEDTTHLNCVGVMP